MRLKASTFLLLVFVIGLCTAESTRANSSNNPRALAQQAVSANPKEAAEAIRSLRAMGPAGLETLFEVYAADIKQHLNGAQTDAAAWQRLSNALDAVSQQRNSYASRLYWHTELEQARAEARKSGKPILSLRLLGNLNEEYSCANSRFFRTVLYANQTVSAALRERFVLHWKSVRPAPKVTIDYGDGRKLERTLTGNSIHYILDREGRVVDALPGLYGPQGFLRGLEQAETLAKQTAGKSETERGQILNRYHRDRVEAITKAWTADALKVGGKVPDSILSDTGSGKSFDARVAGRTAMAKSVSEMTIISAISSDISDLQHVTDDAVWEKIAALHGQDARLDADSIALIRRQTGATDEQLSRLVKKFEHYLAFDTVRNEYTMHGKLHAWLASGLRNLELEAFNERVYKDIFLTPRTDPWLGLYSPDTYTALDNGGINEQ